MGKFPYIRDINHERSEVGPISPGDITHLLENIKITDGLSASLKLNFRSSKGISLEGSSGVLYVDTKNAKLGVRDMRIPNIYSVEDGVPRLLSTSKLESLSLDFPDSSDVVHKDTNYFLGRKALDILQNNLPALKQAGYEPIPRSFSMIMNMFEVSSPHGNIGIPVKYYSGHLLLSTEALVKDQPEMKLVLKYTSDGEKMPEFETVKKIFGELRKNK